MLSSLLTTAKRRFNGFSQKTVEFDATSLPWIDREDYKNRLQKMLQCGEISREEAEKLENWHTEGWMLLPKAIDDSLLDALWKDMERGWAERPVCKILAEGLGEIDWSACPPREQFNHHYRVNAFHNLSEAAARTMMHPSIMRAVSLIFNAPPCTVHSLLFEYGSEQDVHQDFPYVHTQIPSHLVGAWIACEDVDSENGPLVYYSGSHRIPKFNFGGGTLLFNYKDAAARDAYEQYLRKVCEAEGFPKKTFLAKKGDVLLWHGALVHAGSPVHDHTRSRRSFVPHYSTRQAYPHDHRGSSSETVSMNGGSYYTWKEPGHQENRYPLTNA